MGLTLTALPDSHAQIESLQRALREKVERIYDLEEELRQAKAERAALGNGVANLRITLAPLYQALQMIFGHIDAMNVSQAAGTPVSASKQAVWESWKQKLGGANARAIDILMLHGPMTVSNLRIHLSCAARTAQNVAQKLISTGIARRDNGRIALKEL
jgi:hypothetical protein